jgi:hypothetical protein
MFNTFFIVLYHRHRRQTSKLAKAGFVSYSPKRVVEHGFSKMMAIVGSQSSVFGQFSTVQASFFSCALPT